MNRRAFLAGGLVAISGCAGAESAPPTRWVGLTSADEIPDRYDTGATVEVTEPEITGEHTARVRVSVRNTGEATRTYAFEPNPPLGNQRSDSGPRTLFLASPGLEREGAGCWRPKPYSHGDGTARVELAPDESIGQTLELWDVGEGECLPIGEYWFSVALPRFEGEPDTHTWSFTLRLETA